MQRVFHPIAVHFKGSGFYNTDYGTAKRNRQIDASAESGADKRDAKQAETKSDKAAGARPTAFLVDDFVFSSSSSRLEVRRISVPDTPVGGIMICACAAGLDAPPACPLATRRFWPSLATGWRGSYLLIKNALDGFSAAIRLRRAA